MINEKGLTAPAQQVYSFYGQYAASNIVNVVQPLALQTVSNVLALLTAAIACCKSPSTVVAV